MTDLCVVCEKEESEHECVVCFKGVCWTHNWAKSCFAVCYNCRKKELCELEKKGKKERFIDASLSEDWKPLSKEDLSSNK